MNAAAKIQYELLVRLDFLH